MSVAEGCDIRDAAKRQAFQKSAAFLVQILSLPIALAALHTDRYAAFLSLRGALSWASLLTLGLIPTLPKFLAAAHHRAGKEAADERDLVVSSLLFMFSISAALMLFLEALPFFMSPSVLVGHSRNVSESEIRTSFQFVAVLVPAQVAVSVMAAIRSGYQELHISYLWAALANIAILLLLFISRHSQATIWQFFYILYLPLTVCMFCDLGLLILQRPYLLGGRLNFGPTLRLLGTDVAMNGIGMQLSVFF